MQSLNDEKDKDHGILCTEFQSTNLEQATIHELQTQLSAERNGNTQLQTALEDALRAQAHFQQLEEDVSQRLTCVSSELSVKERYITQLESDKVCLHSEMNGLKQQIQLLEEALKDKETLNMKSEVKNAETQTTMENNEHSKINDCILCEDMDLHYNNQSESVSEVQIQLDSNGELYDKNTVTQEALIDDLQK